MDEQTKQVELEATPLTPQRSFPWGWATIAGIIAIFLVGVYVIPYGFQVPDDRVAVLEDNYNKVRAVGKGSHNRKFNEQVNLIKVEDRPMWVYIQFASRDADAWRAEYKLVWRIKAADLEGVSKLWMTNIRTPMDYETKLLRPALEAVLRTATKNMRTRDLVANKARIEKIIEQAALKLDGPFVIAAGLATISRVQQVTEAEAQKQALRELAGEDEPQVKTRKVSKVKARQTKAKAKKEVQRQHVRKYAGRVARRSCYWMEDCGGSYGSSWFGGGFR